MKNITCNLLKNIEQIEFRKHNGQIKDSNEILLLGRM